MEPEYWVWLRENKPEWYEQLKGEIAWAIEWNRKDAATPAPDLLPLLREAREAMQTAMREIEEVEHRLFRASDLHDNMEHWLRMGDMQTHLREKARYPLSALRARLDAALAPEAQGREPLTDEEAFYELPNDAPETIRRMTKAIRAADQEFERVGGSSRHWVRDCFLPELEAEGLRVVERRATGEPAKEGKP